MRRAQAHQARGLQITSIQGASGKSVYRARADTEPGRARSFGSARAETVTGADGAPYGWRLAVSTPDGLVLVPDTGLDVRHGELCVTGAGGRRVHRWAWPLVETVRVGRELSDPWGDALRLVELEAAGRKHLFVCPASSLGPFLSALRRKGPRTRIEGDVPQAAETGRWRRSLVLGLLAGSYRQRHQGRHQAGRRRRTGHPGSEERETRTPREGRHPRRWLTPVGTTACVVVLASGGLLAGGSLRDSSGRHTPTSIEQQMARDAARQAYRLPVATAAPAPAPPSLATAAPLKAHEIFGFAPYWALPNSAAFDLRDLTTLAYFSVDVNGDGSIDQSSPGWAGYQSQALADLVTRAHQAADRVVLTATCFDQASLNAVTSNPAAASTLAASLVDLLRAKNLDGVNLDFEGLGSQDQAGLTRLVTTVSQTLHAVDPHWQVTIDTYASAASDGSGFYDIPGLARSVDAFFVMAYDMNDRSAPSPTAALTGRTYSDEATLSRYTAMVQPSQLILGVPYYGYDWPTAGPAQGDPATGPPAPVGYAQILAGNHPVYWDGESQTPWTSYQVGSQWHQTWFDDATSLALKAQLADRYHLAGLGVWALGMDGNDPSIIAALLGNAPAIKNYQPGPGPASQSPPLLAAPPQPGAAQPSRPPVLPPVQPRPVPQAPPPAGAPGPAPTGAQAPPPASAQTVPPATTGVGQPNPNPGTAQGGSAPPATVSGGNAPPGQGTGTTTTTTAPTPPPAPFIYRGTWNGQTVTLERIDPVLLADPTLFPAGPGQPIGQLTGFQTNDPAYACLAQTPALPVSSGNGSIYVVSASTPTDCTTGTWVFAVPVIGANTSVLPLPGAGLIGGAAVGMMAAGTGAAGARVRSRRRKARGGRTPSSPGQHAGRPPDRPV